MNIRDRIEYLREAKTYIELGLEMLGKVITDKQDNGEKTDGLHVLLWVNDDVLDECDLSECPAVIQRIDRIIDSELNLNTERKEKKDE